MEPPSRPFELIQRFPRGCPDRDDRSRAEQFQLGLQVSPRAVLDSFLGRRLVLATTYSARRPHIHHVEPGDLFGLEAPIDHLADGVPPRGPGPLFHVLDSGRRVLAVRLCIGRGHLKAAEELLQRALVVSFRLSARVLEDDRHAVTGGVAGPTHAGWGSPALTLRHFSQVTTARASRATAKKRRPSPSFDGDTTRGCPDHRQATRRTLSTSRETGRSGRSRRHAREAQHRRDESERDRHGEPSQPRAYGSRVHR